MYVSVLLPFRLAMKSLIRSSMLTGAGKQLVSSAATARTSNTIRTLAFIS
jgi:hypothetical protein